MSLFLFFKTLHLISMVCWFSGLFYLPRLFVYHTQTYTDKVSYNRFNIMEKKLYYFIMMPSFFLTILSGSTLFYLQWEILSSQKWLWLKIFFVAALSLYHFSCAYFINKFTQNIQTYSEKFFRYFNEIPVLFLLGCIILVVYRPF